MFHMFSSTTLPKLKIYNIVLEEVEGGGVWGGCAGPIVFIMTALTPAGPHTWLQVCEGKSNFNVFP